MHAGKYAGACACMAVLELQAVHDDEASRLIDGLDFPAKKMAPRKKYFWRENFGVKKKRFTYPRYKSSAKKHDNRETCHVFFSKKFTCHIPMTSS